MANDDLSSEQRAERGTYVGCIAGALSFEDYEEGLREAGFEDISITSTHESVPGMHSAIVKATRSPASPGVAGQDRSTLLPVVQGSCC